MDQILTYCLHEFHKKKKEKQAKMHTTAIFLTEKHY